MQNKNRFSLVLIVTILAMVTTAIMPTRVLADDGTPPPEATAEAVETSDDSSLEGETGEAISTEEPVATVEPATQEAAVPETPIAAIETPVEASMQGFDVMVMDEEGEAVSQDSQEAIDALMNGSPIWCPAGVTPIPGLNGCTVPFENMALLVEYLNSNQLEQDGLIWIQEGEPVITETPTESASAAPVENAGDLAGESTSQGLDVVILDDQGEMIPLENQEAADALMTGNPVLCPEGESPASDSANCSAPFGSIGLLVSYLSANPTEQDETVYIQTDAVTSTDVAEMPSAELTASTAESTDSALDISLDEAHLVNAEINEALLLGADVVVLDEKGEEIPTVSEEAVDAILAGDPVWCPDGITPTPGASGCTASYGSLGDLVTFLTVNQPAQNGTIWIQQGSDASLSSITIDGAFTPTWANYSLALQGGWNGVSGSTVIDGNTTFSQSITVINWWNDISVSDITAQNTAGNGIRVTIYQGDIALEDVSANNNASTGVVAYIQNGGSGTVNANNITATGNQWNGANFGGSSTFATNSVTVTGVNNFSGNVNNGLFVNSIGSAVVDGVTATGNLDDGVEIWAEGNVFANDITATGNNSDGVGIYTDGNITGNNITSTENGRDGLHASTPGKITINCSSFDNNLGIGVEAGDEGSTFNPAVTPSSLTLNRVTFSGNGGGDYSMAGGGTVIINSRFLCNVEEESHENSLNSALSILPLNLLFATDNALAVSAALDCTNFSGTVLQLANGDFVNFACPTLGDATVTSLTGDEAGMPGPLPEGRVFLAGLQSSLVRDGLPATITDGVVTISFIIPADMLDADLAILYWDGTQWQDLSTAVFGDGRLVFNSGIKTEQNTFEAQTNFTGVFVLVKK